MKLLIDNHCDVNVSINNGDPALILSAYNGHSECVKLIIENDCDVNVSNRNKRTALILASKKAI
jgi:ankyrin repeat protein